MQTAINRTFICSVVFLDMVEYSKKPVAEQIQLKERLNPVVVLHLDCRNLRVKSEPLALIRLFKLHSTRISLSLRPQRLRIIKLEFCAAPSCQRVGPWLLARNP